MEIPGAGAEIRGTKLELGTIEYKNDYVQNDKIKRVLKVC